MTLNISERKWISLKCSRIERFKTEKIRFKVETVTSFPPSLAKFVSFWYIIHSEPLFWVKIRVHQTKLMTPHSYLEIISQNILTLNSRAKKSKKNNFLLVKASFLKKIYTSDVFQNLTQLDLFQIFVLEWPRDFLKYDVDSSILKISNFYQFLY